MIQKREDIKEIQKWNVEALYPNWDLWKKDFASVSNFTDLNSYKEKYLDSSEVLKKFFKKYFNIQRLVEKLYAYAHLRLDEDLGNDENKEAFGKISSLAHDFQIETSWVEPGILNLPEETFLKYLKSESLEPYHFFLEKLHRFKPHTLSIPEEKLFALSNKALDSNHKAFSAFNNADLNFSKIKDKDGKEHELTNGLYSIYMRSFDRTLRKNAFENLHQRYFNFENTLCELLAGQMQSHLYLSHAKKFNSCLESVLYIYNIDPKVYANLLKTTREKINLLHKYIEIRKKVLKLDEIHLYDLYVPLVEDVELNFSYERACQLVIESVALLGEEYQKTLEKGLLKDRWVDPFENMRKRSGAYSSGCYDSMPYILMNYHGSLNDVLTLAHEAGHSMHSYLSRKNQAFHEAQYPIFVAEVASTFNEQLLLEHLLKQTKNPKEKAYLLNYKIEGIRTTFFRQTMFAEFELFLHECAEKKIPLTPSLLKEKYLQLNREYFGPVLLVDDEISIEWSRIPHFYYHYYVYQYATGISAAYALFKKVKESDECKQRYLQFLQSGGSKYPLDLLRLAGVDMLKSDSIEAIVGEFDLMLDEFESLQTAESSSISIT